GCADTCFQDVQMTSYGTYFVIVGGTNQTDDIDKYSLSVGGSQDVPAAENEQAAVTSNADAVDNNPVTPPPPEPAKSSGPPVKQRKLIGGHTTIYLYGMLLTYNPDISEDVMAAQNGESLSQLYGGDAVFFTGRYIKTSRNKAVKLWTKAAEQGNIDAKNRLGLAY